MSVREWRELAERKAGAAGVPAALVLAFIEVESGGNPRAVRGEPQINDASRGLMQLLLRTARALGYNGPAGTPVDLSGLYDPDTNVEWGTRLVRDLWRRKTGDIERIASAYNGGERGSIGFGERVNRTGVRVCLAYDPLNAGNCLVWREVPVGEFANQAYVEKVSLAYLRWSAELAPTGPGASSLNRLDTNTPASDTDDAESAAPMDRRTLGIGGSILAALAALGAWLFSR